jgi:hypothetical protein
MPEHLPALIDSLAHDILRIIVHHEWELPEKAVAIDKKSMPEQVRVNIDGHTWAEAQRQMEILRIVLEGFGMQNSGKWRALLYSRAQENLALMTRLSEPYILDLSVLATE